MQTAWSKRRQAMHAYDHVNASIDKGSRQGLREEEIGDTEKHRHRNVQHKACRT
jgi:hypothetical protein